MMLSVVMADISLALEPVIVDRFRLEIVPSGVAKKCVAMKSRHTNTSLCTRGAGGDTPQLTPRETDLQRDTKDSKPILFRTRHPSPSGGTPLEEVGDDWMN